MMEFIQIKIEGSFLIQPRIFEDIRDKFIKTFHKDIFLNMGVNLEFVESYYSISQKNIIRRTINE